MFHVTYTRQKQDWKVNSLKAKHIGGKVFNEMIYGADTPCGATTAEQDFEALNRENLVEFHNNYCSSDRIIIMLPGKLTMPW